MSVVEIAHNVEDDDRTDDVKINENTTFDGLMLSNETLQGLKTSGFVKPSPVQLRAIPLGKCGFDLIVEAKSGTGKTAVFGIIALEMIIKNGGLQVLILAPTREIASQIGLVLKTIGSAHGDLNVETVMGGTDINDDVSRLNAKKFQILVGSPGRVLHLIKKNAISTRSVRLLVLDEADKLMEDSFQSDVNYIFSHLPERKQIIAASATYTTELRKFLEKYMRAPSHICPHISTILLGVTQNIALVASHDNNVRQNKIKLDKAIEILTRTSFKQCLMFCKYQVRAQSICESLCQEGWPSEYLAGSQSQSDRLRSLEKLQSFTCKILVATDLAARGIDASNVDLVINIDTPGDYPTYLHRIGRAGRYGSKGIAITILTDKEEPIFKEMVNSLGETNIPQLDVIENSADNSNDVSNTNPSLPDPVIENTDEDEEIDPTCLSLIGPLEDKKINYESFDILLKSLENFIPKDSSDKIQKIVFNKDNMNLSKFISSHVVLVSPPDDLASSPPIKNKGKGKGKKKIVKNTNISKIYTMCSDDSPPQNDQTNCSNVQESKSSIKDEPRPTRNDSTINIDTDSDTDYHDAINENNLEYGQWRQQLDAVTKQIEQVVYIETLLNIDRQSDV